MASIVYGAPYIPPSIPGPSFERMDMRWECLGSTWPLTTPASGLFLMPGVRGLGAPKHERHSTSSAAAPGSRYEGSSVEDREIFWPTYVFHDSGSLDWIERDRAFWRTMNPEVTGIWTVALPDGSERSLECRFVDDGDYTAEHDPISRGWEKYGIRLVAEQPYWVGSPMVRSFNPPAAPLPFFEPTGPQIVNISTGSDSRSATIDNLGDVESYPTWFIDGPMPCATVGVGSQVVTVPFVIDDGKCLVIDSSPDNIGAVLYTISADEMALPLGERKKPSARIIGEDLRSPVDKTAALGEADFPPIPAARRVSLSLTLPSGAGGRVEVSVPSLYRRAW